MYPPHRFHIQCPIFPMLAVSGGFDRFFLNVSLPSITKLPPSGALFWGTPLIHLCGSSLGTRFRLHLLEIFHSHGRVVSRASVDGQGWIFGKRLSPPELEDWTVGFSMTFQGQVDCSPRILRAEWTDFPRDIEAPCIGSLRVSGLKARL